MYQPNPGPAEITMIYPPGVVPMPTVGTQQVQQQQVQQVQPTQPTVINLTESAVPPEFKRTKYEDTLELKDLKPLMGQKAPKRFFCARCMDRGVQTGYTKRNDLVKHLDGCGMIREKKYKCDYENCTSAYLRIDNLKQHIAQTHTKKFLYFCKKCQKGFYTSPEASGHRKMCYPGKPDADHTTDETKETETKETETKVTETKEKKDDDDPNKDDENEEK